MKNEKPEFLEVISDMSQFAGALAGAAVVGGKKVIRCFNDLATVETSLKPSADKKQKSKVKSSKNTEVD